MARPSTSRQRPQRSSVSVRPIPTPGLAEERASAVGSPEIVDERRSIVRFLFVLIAVVAAFGVSLWGLTDTLVGAEKVELPRLAVPSVESLTLEEATARLTDAGFTVTVMYQPNEVKPKGTVLGQRPLAGYKADQGDLVTILASDGPLGFTVPNIVGLRLEEALVTLSSASVRIEQEQIHDEEIRAGEVIATLPPPESRIAPNGLLRLSVSLGPAPRVVPDVINQPIENVLVALGRSGLMVGSISETARPELAEGTVVALDPAPGSELPRDTPVKITVSVSKDLKRVPYLTGLTRESAEEMLRSQGLQPQVVSSQVPAGDPSIGRVIGQGTAPQARVPSGSSVAITVAVPAS